MGAGYKTAPVTSLPLQIQPCLASLVAFVAFLEALTVLASALPVSPWRPCFNATLLGFGGISCSGWKTEKIQMIQKRALATN